MKRARRKNNVAPFRTTDFTFNRIDRKNILPKSKKLHKNYPLGCERDFNLLALASGRGNQADLPSDLISPRGADGVIRGMNVISIILLVLLLLVLFNLFAGVVVISTGLNGGLGLLLLIILLVVLFKDKV